MQTHADSMQTGLYQSEMTSDINLSQIEVRLDHFRYVCMCLHEISTNLQYVTF